MIWCPAAVKEQLRAAFKWEEAVAAAEALGKPTWRSAQAPCEGHAVLASPN